MSEYVIREEGFFPRISVTRLDHEWDEACFGSSFVDRRDLRTQQNIGQMIFQRPDGFTASGYADLLDAAR